MLIFLQPLDRYLMTLLAYLSVSLQENMKSPRNWMYHWILNEKSVQIVKRKMIMNKQHHFVSLAELNGLMHDFDLPYRKAWISFAAVESLQKIVKIFTFQKKAVYAVSPFLNGK